MRVIGAGKPSPDDQLDPDGLEEWYSVPGPRHIRANFVATVDGAIEVGGRSAALGGPGDHQVFHLLRSLADVVLVGAGTARSEDYGPVRTSSESRRRRVERGQHPIPPVAVISGRASLDPAARLFERSEGPPPIILTTESAPVGTRRPLEAVAEVVICGEQVVDMALVVDALAARGLGLVLCEGGPNVLGQLAAGGHLDELCLTHSPLFVGPGHRLLSGESPLAAPVRLHLSHLIEDGGMLMARYQVERET